MNIRHTRMKRISISFIISLLFLTNCGSMQINEETFLSQYEFDDFSQFKGTSVFIRGFDSKKNPIVFINAPHLLQDTLNTGLYAVTLDKNTNDVITSKWLTTEFAKADTSRLNQLAQTFISYNVARLEMDEVENILVYFNDVKTLKLAKLVDTVAMKKHYKEFEWIRVKGYWYKPKLKK